MPVYILPDGFAFRVLMQRIFGNYFSFVIDGGFSCILIKEIHKRAVDHEWDNSVCFILKRFQPTNTSHDDKDGYSNKMNEIPLPGGDQLDCLLDRKRAV